MRIVFGVLSLLVVVAVIGVLVKKQLGGVTPSAAVAPAGTSPSGAPVLSGTPQQQVQQFKQAVEGAVQQPRPMPDDK